ncbi:MULTISPECIES: 4'-phosphopantetheinyl transferase family protein [unclassified Luteococcus]|uniref:4'-phosphopantetheinyl transferase family protein n=1 Tax=unclassified Luteococcus TaxID=2639923 RepID=UPI00313DBDCF
MSLTRPGALPTGVWLATGPAARAHELLLELARERLGLTGPYTERLRLGHACPGCGSGAHGRPVLLGAPAPVGVSLSRDRTGELAVAALSRTGQVGVDVEAATAAGFPGFDELAVHPDEPTPAGGWTAVERTRLWVRKEAALKAWGTGLAVDPRRVRLDDLADVSLLDVDLGPRWVCALALQVSGAAPGARAASAG